MQISYVICNDYCANRCFKTYGKKTAHNGRVDHLIKLRDHLLKLGIYINTYDVCKPHSSDLILVENLHFQHSKLRELKSLAKPMILICSESEAVLEANSNIKWLKFFDSVFTYNDELLSSSELKNINKFNYTFEFPQKVPRGNWDNKKLLCLISANKRSKHQNELYSKRVEIIKWYEKN